MADEKNPDPEAQYITYTIACLGLERWFVDSNKGTSGYSFHSMAEAQRFAITLAKRNTPSKVCTVEPNGDIVDEFVFTEPPPAGE
ncbi:MAG: hypothetical protein ABIS45_01825 [Burkholderiales bacterium]